MIKKQCAWCINCTQRFTRRDAWDSELICQLDQARILDGVARAARCRSYDTLTKKRFKETSNG
ncbi:MAG: hypothetical protein WCS07_11990 [Sphaerochaeta sp.]